MVAAAPGRVRDSSGAPVRVAGDPALIRVAGVDPSEPALYALAVETVDGVSVLTAPDFTSNRWAAERLPVPAAVASVALIDAAVDGRPSLLVAYRVGEIAYTTYRSSGPWQPPEAIRCGA